MSAFLSDAKGSLRGPGAFAGFCLGFDMTGAQLQRIVECGIILEMVSVEENSSSAPLALLLYNEKDGLACGVESLSLHASQFRKAASMERKAIR